MRQRAAPAAPLGLELAERSLRLVERAADEASPRIARYRVVPLPPGLNEPTRPLDIDRLATLLREAHRQLGSRTRTLAVALPNALCHLETLELPFRSGAALDGLVRDEAARRLPMPIEAAYLDYRVLGPHPGQPDLCQVLLGAAPRERVEELLAVVELADLLPVVVEPALCAALAALPAEPGQTIALLEQSGRQARLSLGRDGVPLASQPLPPAAFAPGERLPDGFAPFSTAIAPPPLAMALHQALQALPATPTALWLSGDAPGLAALADTLTRQGDLPCHLAQPPGAPVQDGPALLTAFGLALPRD